mgnify:CR=1 FL=1
MFNLSNLFKKNSDVFLQRDEIAKMLKTYKNIPESETTKNLDKISYFKLFEFIIGARDNCTNHKIATNELQAMLIHLYKNKFLTECQRARKTQRQANRTRRRTWVR